MHYRLRSRLLLLLTAVTLVTSSACSSGDDDDDVAVPEDSVVSSTSAPAATAVDNSVPDAVGREAVVTAVEALLQAEQAGDHAASYALLSEAGRVLYPGLDDWTQRRNELPAITGFEVESGRSEDEAIATVSHEPGLDAFIGLSPAEERQIWTGVQENGAWLILPDPVVEPIFPPESEALDSVRQWVSAVQACDQDAAGALEAVDVLFVSGQKAAGLCGTAGTITLGPVGTLVGGPVSADIVAQYGSEALDWARVVPVETPVAFNVIVAPVGDQWLVLGFYD